MNKPLILAVDDERHIRELLSYNLEASGFRCTLAGDGESALTLASKEHPAVILLDLMLPGMGGIEVCRLLKANSKTMDIPIIVLSAKEEDVNKVLALELGADDYVTKPFSVLELMARIKALLRRTASQEDPKIIRIGSLVINSESYEASRNGEKLQLTLKEFELLKLLASSSGKVLTRDFIMDRVWGTEFYGETRTVDVHVRHLRMKLGSDADYIRTVRGVGYKFFVPQGS